MEGSLAAAGRVGRSLSPSLDFAPHSPFSPLGFLGGSPHVWTAKAVPSRLGVDSGFLDSVRCPGKWFEVPKVLPDSLAAVLGRVGAPFANRSAHHAATPISLSSSSQ